MHDVEIEDKTILILVHIVPDTIIIMLFGHNM